MGGWRATLLLALGLLACSSVTRAEDHPAGNAGATKPVETGSGSGAPSQNGSRDEFYEYDPWETANRKIFWFNDRVDFYVLEPTAKAWDWMLPDAVQKSISNFFWHIRVPIYLANDLLQLKPKQAGIDLARFFINTTVGVAGFMDPAGERWGFVSTYEDTGQTFGVWRLGPGPYLVLPLLGPSNLRDGVGLIGDSAMSIAPFFVDSYILVGARVTEAINTRSLYLTEIDDAKATSFDYYSFVRSSYLQRRKKLIKDSDTGITEDEAKELYYPDQE